MFKSFSELNPTTMVLVYELDCIINIKKIFPLIRVNPKTGPIISVSYDGVSRGIKKKDFRNSITLYINFNKKVISVKISKNKIHLCGITSFEGANELIEIIINLLEDILNNVNRIKQQHKINFVKTAYLYNTDDFIKCFRNEYTEKDFLKFLYWLYNLDDIIIGELKVLNLKEAMINYNYDLGFSINRWELFSLFSDLEYMGFYCNYNNSINYSVIIIYKDNDNNFHTIIVYKSGLVTQSGKKIEQIERLYNIFMDIIFKNKSKICAD